MSDEIQRLLGTLQANMEHMSRRLGRVESAFILIGASAVGLVVVAVLRSTGTLQ